MHGVCDQCHEYITEMDHCRCTHAIHTAPELECPWCGLDAHERADVLHELGLEESWPGEVVWIGHNYPAHRPGCGPVYGFVAPERSFAHCFGCRAEMPFEREV
jgi:hypothetical protein